MAGLLALIRCTSWVGIGDATRDLSTNLAKVFILERQQNGPPIFGSTAGLVPAFAWKLRMGAQQHGGTQGA